MRVKGRKPVAKSRNGLPWGQPVIIIEINYTDLGFRTAIGKFVAITKLNEDDSSKINFINTECGFTTCKRALA